ncbi:MAG: MG2 domain-containing protein, partial [Polaromonas sp.]|nr:MG2 domain-containing protein [Polaromonas sp.]
MRTAAALAAAAALYLPTSAQALQVTSLSPQGEIAKVRQIAVKFDESAVNFGDPKAPAPVSLSCSDAQATKGSGRWISDRQWAFEFENDLPPGVSCTLQGITTFRSPKDPPLSGTLSWKFNTGGPFVQNLRPGTYQRIDEEQYFVLQLNGPATLASVRENVWCSVEGLGERVPVKLIEGKEREALLKSQNLDKAAEKDPLRVVTLACNRRLTPASKLQLVYGKGVSTPSGVANSVERRYNFQVREPFSASFNCERENAQSACLPIRPMRLDFNAPVPRKLAEAIRLKSAKDTLKPVFDTESSDGDNVVNGVSFKPPFAEQTAFTVELPKDFKDASGRALRNADNFPLKVATGAMPPLAKFSAAPFGIVERFAEPGAKAGDPALLPVTLRNVEAALQVRGLTPGKVSDLQPKTDADIIAWFRKIEHYNGYQVDRGQAARDVKGPLPKAIDAQSKEHVQSRMLSLLNGQPGVKTLDLPKPASGDPRPFEVIGIPLSPGFHVVEIASPKLGASLLDERHGDSRTMVVRTSALVTNLGVHFKLGRENALAWVTTLDKGAPVAGATVRVSSCDGKELAKATTDAQGLARFNGLSSDPLRCGEGDYGGNAYFVSARAASGGTLRQAQGERVAGATSVGAQEIEDLAFTWSNWQKGIEPWRFNVPTSQDPQPDARAHTIFDRTLLRAGETVSMKHVLRTETSQGFGLLGAPPATLVVTHVGSGQQYTQPITWRKTATGGQSAENTFAIPPAAKLGIYEVQLKASDEKNRSFSSGQFRVEEFRLPVLEGRITPADKKALVNVSSVPTDVQVNYVSGGAAVNLPVRVSALVRGKTLSYSDHEAFSFSPPRARRGEGSEGEEEATAAQDQRVIVDKLPLSLDRNGAGKLTIQDVPAGKQPRELLLEASYADPN